MRMENVGAIEITMRMRSRMNVIAGRFPSLHLPPYLCCSKRQQVNSGGAGNMRHGKHRFTASKYYMYYVS